MISVTKYFLALLIIYCHLFLSSVLRAIPNWNCLLSIKRKLAGQTLDMETTLPTIGTFVHELDSEVKLVEDDGLIDMFLGNRSNLQNAFSDNPEISFVSQNKLVDVRPWTNPGSVLNFLHCPDGGCDFDTD